jgi:hypothetical protein
MICHGETLKNAVPADIAKSRVKGNGRIRRMSGQSHLQSRSFVPPPLTPPHKGEGDADTVFRAEIVEVCAM